MTKRITALFLTLVTLLGLVAVPANAASTLEEAMAEVNVYARNDDLDWLRVNGALKVQHYTFYLYRSEQTGQTKEIPAYCTDPRLYGVPALVPEGTSIKYGADGTVTDPKIMGICANGYPHIDLATLGVQSVEEAYYATKTALWCYLLSTWDISKLSVNPNADQAAAQRVLKATQDIYYRGMQWDKLVEPKLTATPDRDTAYAATVNGESVYQQIFTVTSETWSIEPVVLSLASGAPSGTKILDMSNNEVSRPNIANATHGDDGYSWQVKVVYPASAVAGEDGTVQLNMNSVVVQYELFHAKCLETDIYGNAQRYVLDTDPHTPIAASAISTYSSAAPSSNPTPSSGETAIKIRKLETGTNTPLAGAVFEVKYPDGSTVGSFSTGSDGTITIPVTVTGNYTVTETASAKNHLLPDVRTQSVTVTHGHTATVTFTNAPYGNIRVEKVSDTGEKLGGVTVQIKHIATGATRSAQTNSAGVAEFSQLPIGGYEVRETAGIEGWQFDGDTVQTVAVTTGETSTVTFVNKELPGLRIVKYDRTTLQTLPDATFEIFKDGTSIGRYTTDAMGEIVFTDAAPGTYLVREVQSVDSHITDTTPQEVELKAGDGIRQLVFYNDLKPGIHLVKVDSADLSKPIANAKFSIRAVDGSYGPTEFTTGADGTIDLSRLPTGAYVVTELSCPGYVIDDAQRIIHLDGNENAEFVFTNSVRPSIHIVKLSSDGTPLPGVAFRIAKIEDGSHYLDRITDTQGSITIENLDPGVYSVQEIDAPSGYIINEMEYHVQLFPGQTSQLVVCDDKKPDMKIVKKDADTGAVLAGATFKVNRADGSTLTTETTDANGEIFLKELDPGVYQITEVSPPTGYLPAEQPTQLVTLEPNKLGTVIFENHIKPTLTVNKIDSVTGAALKGAKFHVTYTSNQTFSGEINDLGNYYTDENGQFVISELKDGWYKVTELAAPTGYSIADPATQEFYVLAGTGKTVTFENTPLSALCVFKYDTVTGEAVKNAVFQVKYLSGTSGTGGTVIGTYLTSANGSFTVTGLKAGAYVVEELASDSGHVIDTAPQTAFISGSDQYVVQLYFGNAPKGSALIRKIDSITHAPLSGVQFYITDSTGAALGEANGKFTTDASGSILIDNLDPGTTLIVKESRAISGYILDDTPQTVQVRSGKTVKLEFLNQPKGNLIIEKYDSVTKERLAGATFRVTDASGKLLADNERLTSTNGLYTTNHEGQIVLSKVDPSTLVVTEVTAPDNYKLDSTPQTVVIGAGDTQTLRFYDDPHCTLTIAKRDAVTKAPLKGAEFTVKYSDGTYVGTDNGRFVTGTDGTVTVSGLKPNATVIVGEDKAPTGYLKDESPKSIVVRSGAANSLTFEDEAATTLIIRKYIEGTENEPLSGVAFKVIDGSGAAVGPDDGVYYTDKAGEIVLTGLEPGTTVKARETKTVSGYVLNTTPQTITVTGSGSAQTVTMPSAAASSAAVVSSGDGTTGNQLTFYDSAIGKLELIKVDAANRSKRLANATFEIRRMDQGVVTTVTTDRNGRAAAELDAGSYYAVEVEAPSGYRLDSTPAYFTITDGKTSTVTVTNRAYSGITIHKTDATTGKGIYGVSFLLYDARNNVVGQYASDNKGYVYIEGIDAGRYRIRELENPGYVEDTQLKTVVVRSGEVTLVEWKNTPITGQIQITKTSADYNSMNGWSAGTPIPNTIFEVYDRAGNVVDTIKTGKNGVAVTRPLPLGRYKLVEARAAEFYGLDQTPIEVEIEFAGQIVRAAMTNKSLYTNVSITKRGYVEVMPGQSIRYDFSNIANNSTTALESFYFRDTLPINAVRLDKIVTGTWNAGGSYKIVYKTNLTGGEYRVLADNLSTGRNYVLNASPATLGLASGEYVTEIMAVFGVVPSNFRQVEAPRVYCTVLNTLIGGTEFTNTADAGGVYNGQWIMAADRWTTRVYAPTKPLPRTGY